VDRELAAGPFVTRWDGTTDSGSLADPGLYFVELEHASQRLSRRIAWLR
jgi:hypothetical protein